MNKNRKLTQKCVRVERRTRGEPNYILYEGKKEYIYKKNYLKEYSPPQEALLQEEQQRKAEVSLRNFSL